MNSLNLYLTVGLVSLLTIGCELTTKRDSTISRISGATTLVDPKYSLSKDRTELDKLRQSIPPDLRKNNDEKALMADLFFEIKRPPEEIRDKFDSLSRKKRDIFQKDMAKNRDDFNKVERKKRDEISKQLEEERKDFLKTKVDSEKRAEFFNEQDEKRRNFSAELKDKREDFEADMREKRKNYEDYYKEKNDEFNAELRSYRVKWAEKNKN